MISWSEFMVMMRSRVWPLMYVGTLTRWLNPLLSRSLSNLSASELPITLTWRLKSPVVSKLKKDSSCDGVNFRIWQSVNNNQMNATSSRCYFPFWVFKWLKFASCMLAYTKKVWILTRCHHLDDSVVGDRGNYTLSECTVFLPQILFLWLQRYPVYSHKWIL